MLAHEGMMKRALNFLAGGQRTLWKQQQRQQQRHDGCDGDGADFWQDHDRQGHHHGLEVTPVSRHVNKVVSRTRSRYRLSCEIGGVVEHFSICTDSDDDDN